jgi:hypothetical protein
MEPTATLHQRARFYWLTWAPAVLACGGDYERERATLARPGVGEARLAWDDTVAQLREREHYTGVRALNEVLVASACIEAALARSDIH